MKAPFVSVVVPTYNRARLLRDCLQSLVAQDYSHDRYEIVVVDDGSTDETQAVTEEARLRFHGSGILYVRQNHRGLNAARNAGVLASSGDPICFVDDDVDAPPGWLPAMVEGVLRHPDSGCFGGPARLRLEGKPPRMCRPDELNYDERDMGVEERRVSDVGGLNMAVRRFALQQAGMFNESLSGWGDETEWIIRYRRSGGTIWYVPDAWLWHRRSAERLKFAVQLPAKFRQGVHYAKFLGIVGKPAGVTASIFGVLINLGHAVKRRCAVGILTATMIAGQLWGTLRHRT